MNWEVPQYNRELVNRAASILLDESIPEWKKNLEFAIMNNWRTSHHFPLNTFQVRLRRMAGDIDDKSLIVQRIKRFSSIKSKLLREPKMKLSQMQDIGGCRAVVESIAYVDRLVLDSFKNSELKHKLLSEKDYIRNLIFLYLSLLLRVTLSTQTHCLTIHTIEVKFLSYIKPARQRE